MKLKGLLAAGAVILAGSQPATATNYTLGLFQGSQANSHIHYYVDSGQGTITYSLNVGGGGNTGGLTLVDGNGSDYGTMTLSGNVINSNLSIAQNNGAPAHLVAMANHDGTGSSSVDFSWRMLVGANDQWHLNNLIDSVQGQQITGTIGTVNRPIDADYSAPFSQPIFGQYIGATGGAIAFYGPDGQGDPRFIPNTPSCRNTSPNGDPGCGGDNNAIEITGPGDSGQLYSAIRYDGVFQIIANGFTEYHQVFSVFGQGAYTVNGQTITHFSLMPVQVSYVTARIPVGSTAVPEPMTMSLLGGALGVGAIRRRFKKS